MWIFGRKGASGLSACSTAEEVTQGIDANDLTAIVTGVMACPFMLSQENIELQFATNHLGHFLLTNLLLETMKTTAQESHKEGRIVDVSSLGHNYTYKEGICVDNISDESSYKAWFSYGQSKHANILHANELARRFKLTKPDNLTHQFIVWMYSRTPCFLNQKQARLSLLETVTYLLLPMSFLKDRVFMKQEEGVENTTNSLHPGTITTNLMRHLGFFNDVISSVYKYALKNCQQGAATTCYVALHPHVKGVSGEYFADSNTAKRSTSDKDEELAKKLWDFSLSLTELK